MTLTKTLKVSDPEYWNTIPAVTVALLVLPVFEGKTGVRIFVQAVDECDAAMHYTTYISAGDNIMPDYERIKTYIYDRMPSTISQEWLFEHGFEVF